MYKDHDSTLIQGSPSANSKQGTVGVHWGRDRISTAPKCTTVKAAPLFTTSDVCSLHIQHDTLMLEVLFADQLLSVRRRHRHSLSNHSSAGHAASWEVSLHAPFSEGALKHSKNPLGLVLSVKVQRMMQEVQAS